MEGRTLLVHLVCVYSLTITTKATNLKFTKGIDCSMKYQNRCDISITPPTESYMQTCGCRFLINVCLVSENDIILSYLPPLGTYGIQKSSVYLNLYNGDKSTEYDMFQIPLNQKPCRFNEVLPGKYDVWMSPIDPDPDYENYDDNYQRCDCFGYNFKSNKFIISSNMKAGPMTVGPVSISVTSSIAYMMTPPEFTESGLDSNEAGEINTRPGIVHQLDPSNDLPKANLSHNNSLQSPSGYDTWINTTDNNSTKITGIQDFVIVIIVSTISSTCLLIIFLVVMAITRKKNRLLCINHKNEVKKQVSGEPSANTEPERAKENPGAETYDSGVDMSSGGEGFQHSDIATLRERCGSITYDTGTPNSVFDLYGYTRTDESVRDPSIYPAITILDGTFEQTNYVHPLVYVESGGFVNPTVPCSCGSISPHVLHKSFESQHSTHAEFDFQPQDQVLEAYPNGNITECDLHRGHTEEVQRSGIDSIEFIPPDPTFSECYDITSGIIEQEMFEINRNYNRNVSLFGENRVRSSVIKKSFSTGNKMTDTNIDPVSVHDYPTDDIIQDSSDISIGGISL